MMRIAFLLLVLALLLCGGCTRRQAGSDPTAFSYHTTPQARSLQRIVALPLYRGDGIGTSAGRLDASLASSLRETNLYEVAVMDRERRDRHFQQPDLGLENLTADSLRRFRVATGADAVLVGRVDHFESYDPIAVGLEVHLISCRDGSTAWSASGHFDGRREDVQRDIEDWFETTAGRGREQIGGWRSVLQSPSLFSRYVADRLTGTLLPKR